MTLDAISKDVLSRAKSKDVKFINLQFTDITGLGSINPCFGRTGKVSEIFFDYFR